MTMQRIKHVELSSAQASIIFSSIPQTYRDLVLVYSGRFASGTGGDVKIEFNGVTTNYSHRQLYGNGSSAISSSGTLAYVGRVNPANSTASTFSNVQIYIPNYTSGNAKSWSVDSIDENNGTLASQNIIAGLWNPSTQAAISTITLTATDSSNFLQNSSATLYGISAGTDSTTTVS